MIAQMLFLLAFQDAAGDDRGISYNIGYEIGYFFGKYWPFILLVAVAYAAFRLIRRRNKSASQ